MYTLKIDENSEDMFGLCLGDKFYSWDRKIWQVIDFPIDGYDRLVLIKSWNKYKKSWTYKVEHLEIIRWWIAGHNQLTKRKNKDGYYHVKAHEDF